MEFSTLIIFLLVIIGFFPQIHLLSMFLIMFIVDLFYKLSRIIIDLLGIFVCLIIFCPIGLFFTFFCIYILI
jgi:hypothetical protein